MERGRVPRLASLGAEASAIRLRRQHEDPVSIFRDAGGVLSLTDSKWQRTIIAANGADVEEERLPISALLARIRRLVPKSGDEHYDEIVRNFGVGTLRPPATPMSDGELARAIAEFLKEQPSSESVTALGRRLDPSTPL
ncbi:hypothetical protein [Bradyrhizobium sp. 149]|uniref:hypothetical protein n=1 Tax=Bradyrhizobium sp. 149 TaxID=2782624 RepID=UPI001FF94988|nr:hypothetical protein [Bradyrhizobium sp. 149]